VICVRAGAGFHLDDRSAGLSELGGVISVMPSDGPVTAKRLRNLPPMFRPTPSVQFVSVKEQNRLAAVPPRSATLSSYSPDGIPSTVICPR
jgi:hypothetical protein